MGHAENGDEAPGDLIAFRICDPTMTAHTAAWSAVQSGQASTM